MNVHTLLTGFTLLAALTLSQILYTDIKRYWSIMDKSNWVIPFFAVMLMWGVFFWVLLAEFTSCEDLLRMGGITVRRCG